MFSFPPKKHNYPARSRLRRWMDMRQRFIADYLNSKTASWNRKRQLVFLVLTGGGYLAGLIFILFSTPVSPHVEHFSTPAKMRQVPDHVYDIPPGRPVIPPDTLTISHP